MGVWGKVSSPTGITQEYVRENCGFCSAAPGVHYWVRLRPSGDRAYACEACNARLVHDAEDRGGAPEDYGRMSQVYVASGGQIWSANETDYWFRTQQRIESVHEEARALVRIARFEEHQRSQSPAGNGPSWLRRLFVRR